MDLNDVAKVIHAANDALRTVLGEAPSNRHSSDLVVAIETEQINPAASDKESHQRWLATAPSSHPNAVPYDELSETQKKKDSLFRAIVHALVDK